MNEKALRKYLRAFLYLESIMWKKDKDGDYDWDYDPHAYLDKRFPLWAKIGSKGHIIVVIIILLIALAGYLENQGVEWYCELFY